MVSCVAVVRVRQVSKESGEESTDGMRTTAHTQTAEYTLKPMHRTTHTLIADGRIYTQVLQSEKIKCTCSRAARRRKARNRRRGIREREWVRRERANRPRNTLDGGARRHRDSDTQIGGRRRTASAGGRCTHNRCGGPRRDSACRATDCNTGCWRRAAGLQKINTRYRERRAASG